MMEMLLEYRYMVCVVGPDGIGTGIGSNGPRFKGKRRLLGMRNQSDIRKGHVIVVFENETVFDSDDIFREGNLGPQFLANDMEMTWALTITKMND